MWCIVNLPNGTQQAVKWDPKAIGQECLEKVCKALGIICEMEYFGLEHWTPNQTETRTHQWINLRNRLSCDHSSSSGIQLMLALRVKFWVPVHSILQESVRNLFYMQAKVDLLEGRLTARDWINAAKLAALLCQADGIRFNELALKAKCPIKLKKEQAELQQQQQLAQQLQQQQESQQHNQQHKEHKERKEKEYVLSFKKPRLSKQKSIESIENNCHHHNHHHNHQHPHLLQQTNSQAAAAALSVAAAASNSLSTTPSTSSAASSSSSTATASSQNNSNSNNSNNNNSTASTSPSNSSTNSALDDQLLLLTTTSPLRVYQDYIIRPASIPPEAELPDDYLRKIAIEHGKLATLKMTPKSAKYWLLQEIQDLPGYGEEIFSGLTTNENSVRCDIAVGANGITVMQGDVKNSIPFSAIAAAKSFRRTFKLEYVDDHSNRKELEIKLPKHAIASGLYRSITERHAFYVCDKVRGVVTNQFTRDLKGTIASMFKEDTELGKRYVFDIQHTCREVHDQARRILHERGIDVTTQSAGVVAGLNLSEGGFEDLLVQHLLPKTTVVGDVETSASASGSGAVVSSSTASPLSTSTSPMHFAAATSGVGGGVGIGFNSLSTFANCSMVGRLDLAIREKEEREAAIERCVDTRISEAMTCKICMDRAINTMFNPCCHVMACAQCAARCSNCPNCRVKITSVVKIYLPPELRMNQTHSSTSTNEVDDEAAADAKAKQNKSIAAGTGLNNSIAENSGRGLTLNIGSGLSAVTAGTSSSSASGITNASAA